MKYLNKLSCSVRTQMNNNNAEENALVIVEAE
jgi:hypothetical protein